MKYYAVKKGRVPGIYMSWGECQQQTKGFSGATFKSFTSKKEAQEYMKGDSGDRVELNFTKEELAAMISDTKRVTAFVDGSFNKNTNTYSYGLVAIGLGKIYEQAEPDDDPVLATMRNVAGEIQGSMEAMKYCLENNIKNLDIYYDYMGIEQWITGGWECNKVGSKAYKKFYDSIKDKLNVSFHKVPAHSGIKYNERADFLAKHELGLA